MLHVCDACGAWLDGPRVEGDEAVCDACGGRRRFRRLALHVVTGASASGKSTLAGHLPGALPGCVVLELDVLWSEAAWADLGDWRRRWLRLAMNVGQSGRPVVLLGTLIPEHVAPLPERALFGEIRYLALTAPRDEIRRRMRARPAWRGATDERLAETISFNDWIAANAARTDPPMRLLDTAELGVDQAVRQIAAWVAEAVPAAQTTSAGWIVRPARRADLDRFDGLGSSLHMAYCRDQYRRAERGEVVMLVAVGPADVPLGKVHVAFADGVGVIGDAAVREELRAILARGPTTAELGVADDNPRARRLYERHGYRVAHADVFRWAVPGPGGQPVMTEHPGVVMRKPL